MDDPTYTVLYNQYRALFWARNRPAWRFVAMARLARMDRALLTTMWFILGEQWYA